MTSKELIRRTLDFDSPQRVAHSFDNSDMVNGEPEIDAQAQDWVRIDATEWQRTDVWGNVWRRVDETSKGEIHIGALDNLAMVENMVFPDFDNDEYYEHARTLFAESPDKWCVGGVYGFTFSVARKLRKLDQYLMDLILEPEKIAVLHDRVDEQIMAQIKHLAAVGADSIMVLEDWGTQGQTLISPALWRKEFSPRIKKFCTYAHALNMKVFMHSCGKIEAIVPDLIACGIDLFQFDQPQLHGIDTLAAYQKDNNITFWCPVDIQTTLQEKDEVAIRHEAKELIEKLWRPRGGGFIAGFYPDDASIGLEPKWQQMASEQFISSGVLL